MPKKTKRGLSRNNFLTQSEDQFFTTNFPGLITRARESLIHEVKELEKDLNEGLQDWLKDWFKNVEKVKSHIKKINSKEKTFKHPKGEGYHNDCGPHVVSIVTGLSLDQVVEDMEYADVFDEKDYGTYPEDIIDTLRFYEVIDKSARFIPAKNINSIKTTSILGVNRHWVLLVVDNESDDRYILDPQYKHKRRDFHRLPKLESYLPLKCFSL